MGCPLCGGRARVILVDGRFQCMTHRVVDAVPPGVAGNAGITPIPLYEPCGHVFDADQERQADVWRAEQAKTAAADSAARFARQQTDQDPGTPKRIADRARQLIHSRPAESRPVVVEVEIPSRIPFTKPSIGYAEVCRAWPIGPYEMRVKDYQQTAEMGVTEEGAIVVLSSGSPSVALDSRMRWFDPRQRALDIATHQYRAKILETLERALRQTPVHGDVGVPASAQIVGHPISHRSLVRISRLKDKRVAIYYEYKNIAGLYGTRRMPTRQGKPDRHTLKEWRRMERLDARWVSLGRRINAAGGGISVSGLEMHPDLLK